MPKPAPKPRSAADQYRRDAASYNQTQQIKGRGMLANQAYLDTLDQGELHRIAQQYGLAQEGVSAAAVAAAVQREN